MAELLSSLSSSLSYQFLPSNSSYIPSFTSISQPNHDYVFILSQIWSMITIWRVFVALLLLGNIKNIPFMWHLRILNSFRFCLHMQRSKTPITHEHIFKPLITTNYAPLMEIDFNLHKTNSSYFSDIDICRSHLTCTLFSLGIEKMRTGSGIITKENRPMFGLALGAVSCSFRKELKPYESYEMWTRILSWDEKWIYIVTHFVRKGAVLPKDYILYPEQNSSRQPKGSREKTKEGQETESVGVDSMESHPAVVATALSKCVFKQGRRTVSPALMLKQSNLLPTTSLDDAQSLAAHNESISCTSSESGTDVSTEDSILGNIEKERQRGMRVAMTLAGQAQSALEMEFTGDAEALGRHSDGTGVSGVVSTIAQLVGLKRSQLL